MWLVFPRRFQRAKLWNPVALRAPYMRLLSLESQETIQLKIQQMRGFIRIHRLVEWLPFRRHEIRCAKTPSTNSVAIAELPRAKFYHYPWTKICCHALQEDHQFNNGIAASEDQENSDLFSFSETCLLCRTW